MLRLLMLFLAGALSSGCYNVLDYVQPRSSLFDERPIYAMAGEVGVSLPKNAVVAIQPIRGEETGVSDEIARGIEEAFARNLRAGKSWLTVKEGRDLDEIWEEADSFSPAKLEDAVSSLGVDILIVANALPSPDGLQISFRAYDIREGSGGKLVGASMSRNVAVKSSFSVAVSPEEGAAFASRGLYRKIARNLGQGVLDFTVRTTGERSPFIEYLDGLVMENLGDLRQAGREAAPATGDARKAVTLELGTRVRDHGNRATVVFAVEAADGREIARQGAVIDSALIPAQFKPLTPRVPVVTNAVLSATGTARIGPALNRRQALTTARMMARGDVVQQALGTRRTFLDPAQTLSAAHWAMGVLGPAIPYEEKWQEQKTSDPNLLRVHLKARVRHLDSPVVSGMQAQLMPPKIRAGAPMRIWMSGPVDMFVGVFAWRADGTVHRVFPEGDKPSVEVKAGQAVFLPPDGGTALVSRPLPDANQDLEAVIVIFSRTPLDFRRFGGEATETATGPIEAGIPAGLFLDHIAAQDAGTTSVLSLPYIVKALPK